MKAFIFFCAVIALARSKPGGYYHQEYNYKSSAASYKNNELQHKDENEGFYSKDGDLDGMVKPKVNSHSQHSEYTNPKLLSGSSNSVGTGGYMNGGNYLAGSDRLFGSSQSGLQSTATDGYASSDRVIDLSNVYRSGTHASSLGTYGTSLGGYQTAQGYGTLNRGGYGTTLEGGSNYGYTHGGNRYGYTQTGTTYGSSGTYGTNVNLNSLAQRLQNDMSRQLENAVYNQYRSSGYTNSMSNTQMTADIRALEDELKRNLTRQLEENIRSQYGHQTMRGSNSYTIIEGQPSTVINYNNQELAELQRRLEDDLIRKLHQNIRTTYNRETVSSYTSSDNRYQPIYVTSSTHRPVIVVPSNIRYTPIPNPESITQIASKIQENINIYLDTALSNLYSTYLQGERTSYYTLTDFDNQVNRIKDDIIRNLTNNLDDQIRRNYGQQIIKGDNYYSLSSTGEISSQYNYNVKDYDNLRKQVEQNLLQKLNQTVNTYREEYRRKQSYSTNTNSYTVTYRPTYYTTGSQPYGYSDIQRQLSQQLQNALNKRRYSASSSYSASTSYNPQAYQTSFDELSRELQRNLTEQMRNYQAQGTSSASGYISGSSGDFETMKNQLQNQLMQQLQQGLQKQHHYSARASYSASSSSSSNANYGSHQSYGNYGNYMECCQEIDPSAYTRSRSKRDLSYKSHNNGENYQQSFRTYSSRRYTSGKRNMHSYSSHLEPLDSGRYTMHQQIQSGNIQSPQYKDQLLSNNNLLTDIPPEDSVQEQQQLDNHDMMLKRKNLRYTNQLTQQKSHNNLDEQLELSNNYQDQNNNQEAMSQLRSDLSQNLFPSHFNQQLENQDDLTQQLELGKPSEIKHKKSEGKIISNYEQHLSQQLENQNLFPSLGLAEIQQSSHYNREGLPGQEVQNQLVEQDQLSDDLTQQLERDNIENFNSQVAQKLELHPAHETSSQHLQIIRKHSIEQKLQNADDLTQQVERTESNGQQKYISQDKTELAAQEMEQHLTQNLENQIDNDQQLELKHKLKLNIEHKPGAMNHQHDLTQQLENAKDFSQQLDKQKISDQQLENQEDLGQQLENQDSYGQKLENQENLGQKLENLNSLGQQLENQENLGQQLENLNSLGQKLEKQKDLGQQLENLNSLGQQLENQENSGHQLEKLNSFGQKLENQVDLDQQLENQNSLGQQLENQENVGQQLENLSSLGQQLENQEDLGQQLENQNSLGHQLENPEDLGQQLENQNYSNQELDNQLASSSQLELQPKNDQIKNTEQQVQEMIDQTSQQLISDNHKLNLLEGQKQENNQLLQLTNSKNTHLDQQFTDFQDQQIGEKDDDVTQQIELLQSKKQENKILKTPDQDDNLTQQLELTNIPKPVNAEDNSKKPREDQEQISERESILKQHYNDVVQSKIQKHLDQELEQEQRLEPVGTSAKKYTEKSLQELSQEFIVNEKQQGQKQPHQSSEVLEDIPHQQLELTATHKKQNKQQAYDIQSQIELESPQQVAITGSKSVPEATDQKLDQQLESTSNLSMKTKKTGQLETIDQQTTKDYPDRETSLNRHLHYSPERREHLSDTFDTNGVPQQQENMHLTQTGSEQRIFTNGHSGHNEDFIPKNFEFHRGTGMSNYETALAQQDTLLNLLRQKVESQSVNKVDYGLGTIKKTYVDETPHSVSEKTQYLNPYGETVERNSNAMISTFPYGNTRLYGEIPGLASTSGTYSTNTMKMPEFYPYHGELQNNTRYLSSDPFEEHYSQFTQKSTKRVVYFVNGKPVSASENIQLVKPNGEIVQSHHNLPLDSNLLENSPTGFSPNLFDYNFRTHKQNAKYEIRSSGHSRSMYHINRENYPKNDYLGETENIVQESDEKPENMRKPTKGHHTSRHFN